jgi:methanogenic corrinoid protein MtbC1
MAKGISNDGAALKPARSASGRSKASAPFSGPTLSRMVEGDIIPRLLMAHRNERLMPALRPEPEKLSAESLSSEDISSFLSLPLHYEASELLDEIEKFLSRGVGVEQILVNLLATSARKLGDLWEADECDFVDVTMGLWRLQEVMRIVAMRSPSIMRTVQAPPSVLFAPIPGDQHSFGALMMDEVFSRAGWESEVLFEPKRAELLEILASQSFDVVGLTVSNDCPSGDLAGLVSAIRSVSRNAAIRVLVGGRAINADPTLAVAAGADGTATDAIAAVELAEQMVASSCLVPNQV